MTILAGQRRDRPAGAQGHSARPEVVLTRLAETVRAPHLQASGRVRASAAGPERSCTSASFSRSISPSRRLRGSGGGGAGRGGGEVRLVNVQPVMPATSMCRSISTSAKPAKERSTQFSSSNPGPGARAPRRGRAGSITNSWRKRPNGTPTLSWSVPVVVSHVRLPARLERQDDRAPRPMFGAGGQGMTRRSQKFERQQASPPSRPDRRGSAETCDGERFGDHRCRQRMFPGARRRRIDPHRARPGENRALRATLFRLGTEMLDRAAGGYDLVRAHRGVADEDDAIIALVGIDEIAGRRALRRVGGDCSSTHSRRGSWK